MSHLSQRPDSAPDSYEVGKAIPHESAALHVTGLALYTDDLVARTKDCLHAYPGAGLRREGQDHQARRAARVRRARGGPGADRRRRAGRQRCRRQARRAAVPVGGQVLRPCRLLRAR